MELALIVWLVMAAMPAIKGIAIAVACATGIGLLIGLIMMGDGYGDAILTYTRKKLWFIIPFLFVAALLPAEKTSWYMVGAFGTQKLVESPVAQELASDGVDVLKSLMARAKTEIEGVAKK